MKREIKHKWWHFIYGKETKSEELWEGKNGHSSIFWDVCKKCGQLIGEKEGFTTFKIGTFILTPSHEDKKVEDLLTKQK